MKSLVRRGKNSNAFTLTELLVVISIIGLLAGLITTGVPRAMDSAKKAKAKGDLTAIVAAVKAYKQEYGVWPATEPITTDTTGEFGAWYGPSKWATGTGSSRGKDLMKILSGQNIGTGMGSSWPRPMNPKLIQFLEGAQSDGAYLDPWGTQYCVKMDVNESGGLEYGTGSAGNENLRLSVIAVSLGKNKTQEDSPSVSGFDDIYSWGQNLTQ
ncbi:prepilin-type N-terminal cleavage/methylation domain-containing protein [bacterium]|nr:prepilin-type N-terminal cleavage/methylation domain-containing protein [bacterium]